jgi:hypothetical protein
VTRRGKGPSTSGAGGERPALKPLAAGASLEAIIVRTVLLRQLQRELAGDAENEPREEDESSNGKAYAGSYQHENARTGKATRKRAIGA